MNNSGFSQYYHSSDEQVVYAHLQWCVDNEQPQKLIQRFFNLFVQGGEYPDLAVNLALGRIVDSDLANIEFQYVLNRSCYILINRWRKQVRHQWAIPELINIFDQTPSGLPSCWTAKRLRSLVKRFTQTEQYQALRRLSKVFEEKIRAEADKKNDHVEGLISRYPYLYDHCFLTDDSPDEQRQEIRDMRMQAQETFEDDLSKYLTFKHIPLEQRLILPTVENPTLLTDKKLNFALKHFTGKVDGYHTYDDLAKIFVNQSHKARTYRTFKEEFYEYLTDTVDTKYAKKHFNNRLYRELQGTLSHNDSQKVNDTLMAGTCRKLLNFLVVESPQQPHHFVFLDLSSNLGVTHSIGLLLKIVLICRKVKSDLEKRFSILFNHYATFPRDKVSWLVESLENLNIAFGLNWGKLKFLPQI
ncbi:MAG TPA: hypothetical protein DCQ51_04090 [Planktothrix sp. UBA8407]|nr:hypothetical protein [Planktothrix sp. UBA8402]HAO10366.1 hypothetical protein [Planktothrix sp. UBA8407]HBK25010.1 hypothetical protein [Planktothrix sp. UBA10369]